MPERTVMVWIEDGATRISRGRADCVTAEGLEVSLPEAPAFGRGDEVAVRISFDRAQPTVATTARVGWVRRGEGAVECRLEWTATPAERADLEPWLAPAA